jgi:hypothetical protein
MFTYLLMAVLAIGFIYYWNNSSDKDIPNEGELEDDNISETIANEFVNNYAVGEENEKAQTGSFGPNDPYSQNEGSFRNYPQKSALRHGYMEKPFSESDKDRGIFDYKNKKFKVTTENDIKDLKSDLYLPKEQRGDWFDVQPLQTTKKIRGTHLIHPKVWHGVNTVGGSLRNASYDLRGNVPVPKINVSPWLNSTMDPDTNIMGICNSY